MNDGFDETGDIVDELIQLGAIEVTGIDSNTGEFLYTFTEKLAAISPNIYKTMMSDFHSSIMRLWEAGFLSMDVTAENPVVNATEKVFDLNARSNLSKEDQTMLEDILKKMSQ